MKFTPEFIPYYISVVKDRWLNYTEALLYWLIRFYSNYSEFDFPSESLAELLGVSEWTIDNTVWSLKKKWVILVDTKRYKTSEWFLAHRIIIPVISSSEELSVEEHLEKIKILIKEKSITKEKSWRVLTDLQNISQDIQTQFIETDLAWVTVDDMISVWNSITVDWWIQFKTAKTTKAYMDLEKAFLLVKKSYNREWINKALDNYIIDIQSRVPNTSYAKHRFTLLQFLKQSNWLAKFITL